MIEPDVVVSRDGVLVVRHESELSLSTDVAGRPEFADRRTTKEVDGEACTGWFAEDFTLAELRTLRAVERMPELRPLNTAYDGHFGILTLADVVALARTARPTTGRSGCSPSSSTPTGRTSTGCRWPSWSPTSCAASTPPTPAGPVMVQSFEPAVLRDCARCSARTARRWSSWSHDDPR